MNPTRSIRGLLLAAGAVFSIARFLTTLFVVSGIYNRSVRDDAVEDASVFAELTFNAMFELMSTGWNRQQLEGYLRAIQKSVDNTQRQIDIYRGPKVSALFGEIAQNTPDAEILRALKDGDRQHLEVGDLIRVIDVQQNVSAAMASHRERFSYAFAPIVPVMLIVTLLMVLYIRRRLKGPIDALARDIRRGMLFKKEHEIL